MTALLVAVVVAACGAGTAEPGTTPIDRTVRTATAAGTRTAIVHHPASAGRGAPLVVVLHGAFGTGRRAEHDYGWDAVADRDGVVVAYPDGLARAWNVGPTCCGRPHTLGVDDVGYLHQLLDGLAATDGIDRHRVYAVGISNGGMLAYAWACGRPGELAGIGPVAGSLLADCAHPAPVTVAAVHGTADENVPVAGGIGPRGISGVDEPPLEGTLARFRSADGCPPAPVSTTGPPVEQRTWSCAGGATVSIALVDGAGHQWPGAPPLGPGARAAGLDEPSTALDATEWLWAHLRTAHTG
jgi:polyhydroxybutyrate depolymerase